MTASVKCQTTWNEKNVMNHLTGLCCWLIINSLKCSFLFLFIFGYNGVVWHHSDPNQDAGNIFVPLKSYMWGGSAYINVDVLISRIFRSHLL